MTDNRDNQTPAHSNVVYVNQHDKPVNHGLHLLLSIVTFGAWLPVWVIVALTRSGVMSNWTGDE